MLFGVVRTAAAERRLCGETGRAHLVGSAKRRERPALKVRLGPAMDRAFQALYQRLEGGAK